MVRPNLFSFATSELSQDVFLCWLAALAGSDEPALADLGRSFLAWLWREAGHGGAKKAKLARLHEYRQAFAEAVRTAGTPLMFAQPAADHAGERERDRHPVLRREADTTEAVIKEFPKVHAAFWRG